MRNETEFIVKNSAFWDVPQYGPYNNRRFGVTYRLHHHRNVLRLLVTVNIVPSSPILVTLTMEAILC
jgi:hypothetical protein